MCVGGGGGGGGESRLNGFTSFLPPIDGEHFLSLRKNEFFTSAYTSA